ncbi:expressed protein [Echinococcus multilocularis]|uniref:Expressed protein n=1 Tax=Echinococcus multilocularis TaxID=6211 RepID=A0A068YM71_ECHMU|nr:expressed protein [Echinococcus multilocularis]
MEKGKEQQGKREQGKRKENNENEKEIFEFLLQISKKTCPSYVECMEKCKKVQEKSGSGHDEDPDGKENRESD